MLSPTAPVCAVRVRGVTVGGPGREVAAADDADVPAGRVTVVVAPAGTDATWVVDCLAGRRPTTTGSVRVFGADPAGRRGATRVVPRDGDLVEGLDVAANLELVDRAVADLTRRPHAQSAVRLLEHLGAGDVLDRRLRDLPAGERRRVEVAAALATGPDLLVVDDRDQPGEGVAVVLDVLARLSGRTAVVVAREVPRGFTGAVLALRGRTLRVERP